MNLEFQGMRWERPLLTITALPTLRSFAAVGWRVYGSVSSVRSVLEGLLLLRSPPFWIHPMCLSNTNWWLERHMDSSPARNK